MFQHRSIVTGAGEGGKGENMREIKFRAWDGSKGKMTNDFFLESSGLYLDSDPYGVDMSNKIRIFQPPMENHYTIMQYTGLRDKNGKEIYEGDILCFAGLTNKPFVVKWDEKEIRFTSWLPRNTVEIIGNIYENPYLLE